MLDRQHSGVKHGFTQKCQHRVETFKGLVDDNVALCELLKDRLSRQQLNRVFRLERGEAQPGVTHQVNQLRHARQVHRAVNPVQRQKRQIEFLEQVAGQVFRTPCRNLNAHRLAKVAVLQALAQSGAQVFHVVLVHRQIGVAGHPELRKLPHVAPTEQVRQMRPNHT